jgi:hypothetical protein
MSDRVSAINGKRNKEWGTTHECPACGQCLCFGCHPAGPCVDDHAAADAEPSFGRAAFASSGFGPSSAAWMATGTSGASGASGLRMRAAHDAAPERIR